MTKDVTTEPLIHVVGCMPGSDLSVFTVVCRECGEITELESNRITKSGEANLQQADLYRQRHLSRHLTALAEELQAATR